EPALVALRLAARDHLRVLARVRQRFLVTTERLLVNDGAHEVAEVARIAHADLADHRGHAIAHLGPQRTRNVDAARGGALLALELEAAACDGDRKRLRIRVRVRDDEVLAAR